MGLVALNRWKFIAALAFALGAALLAAACLGEEPPPAGLTPAIQACTPTVGTPLPLVSPDAGSAPGGNIAFVSFRDGNREIYKIKPDGSGLTNLTNHPSADDEPDWSPDGSKIAWSSDRDGDLHINVMDADGSGVTQLTSEGGALSPRWSPDGQCIAYSRGGSIVVMNADGSGPVRILQPQPETAAEICRAGGFPGGWSPDGTRITYYAASVSKGLGQVCTVAADGSDVAVVVSEPPVYNVEPVWSPDGDRIAFRSIRDENHDIYVVNLEDSSEQRLTEIPALDIEPAWSPDGAWIAFASNRDGVNTDIYIMRDDGSDVRRLTIDPAKDSYPVWSP